MLGYILKRLLSAIPVLLGISIIVFLIMAMIPGDPATAILGSFATPENVEKLNRDLGLDKTLFQRYFIWLGNILQGDFGRSYSLNNKKQENNLIDNLKNSLRKILQSRLSKKPFTNINLIRL